MDTLSNFGTVAGIFGTGVAVQGVPVRIRVWRRGHRRKSGAGQVESNTPDFPPLSRSVPTRMPSAPARAGANIRASALFVLRCAAVPITAGQRSSDQNGSPRLPLEPADRRRVTHSRNPSPIFRRHRWQTKDSKSSEDQTAPHRGQRANREAMKTTLQAAARKATPQYHVVVMPIITAIAIVRRMKTAPVHLKRLAALKAA